MATYLAHDALRLPAASLLANSGLCVNIEIKIWLLLGVNVDTALPKTCNCQPSTETISNIADSVFASFFSLPPPQNRVVGTVSGEATVPS